MKFPRIGFITAGLLGTWGEWHCYPHSEWFASKTVQAEVMDAYRVDKKQRPTFDAVMRGIVCLKKHAAQFNTLTVVNRLNSRQPLPV